jgi:hypothetical protein
MTELETAAREDALRTAVGRLAEARSRRTGDIPVLVHPHDISPDVADGRRSGLLRFADRARAAAARFEPADRS